MDFKKMIFDMISESSNSNRSYIITEAFVLNMLKNYIHKQEKEFFTEFKNVKSKLNFFYDGYAPEGFDEFIGTTVIEIKMYKNVLSLRHVIYELQSKENEFLNINNIIIIQIGVISENEKQKLLKLWSVKNVNLIIWDINDLTKIFENDEERFINYYNNINSVFLKDTITRSVKDTEDKDIIKNQYINNLKKEYYNDNLVLFLGAGVSMDANIPSWDKLVSELFVTLISLQLKENGIELEKKDTDMIIDILKNQNSNSPLLQARYIRTGLNKEFEESLSEIMYSSSTNTSQILEEISQLCIPSRGKTGIQAIISYNFDDLMEKNLNRLRVKHRPIYDEGIIPENDELGIYHVHGFLPHDKDDYDNISNSLLVFAEDGYHKLMLDPYSWANISQLNFLMNNTCVFIGLSMTDPNLRRLLDIASQKNRLNNNGCRHYAIMKTTNFDNNGTNKNIQKFNNVNEKLQETFFREMDVNIVWINEYKEIPEIIKSIKRV